MKFFLGYCFFTLLALHFPSLAHAQSSTCPYGSTQARIQRDSTTPWTQQLTITQGESFRAGSFHDNSGQFATDTSLRVSGPGISRSLRNESTLTPRQPGTHTLLVTTRSRTGAGCQETATVTVLPRPAAPCQYGSTQARVQKNINEAWSPVIYTTRIEGFNVGSFHDQTGQFARDTEMKLLGPGFDGTMTTNGARVLPPGSGWYRLQVTTKNQTGVACEESAWAWVQ